MTQHKMSDELVERVARALYEASCACDPVEVREPEWGRGGYKTEIMFWHALARAAIAAMPDVERMREALCAFESAAGVFAQLRTTILVRYDGTTERALWLLINRAFDKLAEAREAARAALGEQQP